MTKKIKLKTRLDDLYKYYNNKKFLKYDPLEYVVSCSDIKEQEIVALVAASLSFGRVEQIRLAIDRIFKICNYQIYNYIMNINKNNIDKSLEKFQYRFVNGQDFHLFFSKLKNLLEDYGSLGSFFRKNHREGNLLETLNLFLQEMQGVYYLVPQTPLKSPCKRLFMFLRWMVRKDNIDLGLWDFIGTNELYYPLDVHIFRVSKKLGATALKNPSLNALREITKFYKSFSPKDPVKYDWALSHVGIIENFSKEA